jgi:hypothetical protein
VSAEQDRMVDAILFEVVGMCVRELRVRPTPAALGRLRDRVAAAMARVTNGAPLFTEPRDEPTTPGRVRRGTR